MKGGIAMRMRRVKVKQGLFAFPNGWGGWRKGSGRKPNGKRAGVSHRTRPLLAFEASNEKGLVRIVEYSIHRNRRGASLTLTPAPLGVAPKAELDSHPLQLRRGRRRPTYGA